MSDAKAMMILNGVSAATSAIAIAVACKMTRSAMPLLAFVLVSRFSLTTTTKETKN